MISLNTLIAVASGILIPGLIAWVSVLVKIAKLEARMDAKDEHLNRIERKLDKLLEK